jgi:hypothetical protein
MVSYFIHGMNYVSIIGFFQQMSIPFLNYFPGKPKIMTFNTLKSTTLNPPSLQIAKDQIKFIGLERITCLLILTSALSLSIREVERVGVRQLFLALFYRKL